MSISVLSSSFWHHHNHDDFPGDLRLFKLANEFFRAGKLRKIQRILGRRVGRIE